MNMASLKHFARSAARAGFAALAVAGAGISEDAATLAEGPIQLTCDWCDRESCALRRQPS
jgi:hypothetical protein